MLSDMLEWKRVRCSLVVLPAIFLAVACGTKTKVSPVMQITFSRSGGFAGAATNVGGTIQFSDQGAKVSGDATDYVRELNADETKQLLLAADPNVLAKSASASPSSSTVRYGYQYDITVVTNDGKRHSLTVGDGSSEQLKAEAPAAAYLSSWIQAESSKIWDHRVSARTSLTRLPLGIHPAQSLRF